MAQLCDFLAAGSVCAALSAYVLAEVVRLQPGAGATVLETEGFGDFIMALFNPTVSISLVLALR